jgi:thiamine-monophosphate kinase
LTLARYRRLLVPLNEKSLIRRIRAAAVRRGAQVASGIGDDCAALRLPHGHEVLVTTDFSLEGIHFRRQWHPPDSVGHRCLTRGLSDIAAMGGSPHSAFLSLALPPDLPQKWVDGFVAGFLNLADRYSVTLAGGDTAQSPDGVLADIVMLGSAPAGKAILRSGAQPGDLLYVTGTLGAALAALNRLREGEKLRPRSYPKHFYPEPRLAVGQFLRENKLASAMIDISDGLSTDLAHICEESGVGAKVYENWLDGAVDGQLRPVSFAASSSNRHFRTGAAGPADNCEEHLVSGQGFSRAAKQSPRTGALAPAELELALHGGDEYELLFTARPQRRIPKEIAGVAITRIGEIIGGKGMKLLTADGKRHILQPQGWEHFA